MIGSRRSALAVMAATTVVGIAFGQNWAAAGGSPQAGSAETKRVKVGDNFFSPAKTSVPKSTTVAWKWLRKNNRTHNVLLVSGPKGVKRFQSESASTGYTFRRKLRKAGRYFLTCTFHPKMTMRIRVKG